MKDKSPRTIAHEIAMKRRREEAHRHFQVPTSNRSNSTTHQRFIWKWRKRIVEAAIRMIDILMHVGFFNWRATTYFGFIHTSHPEEELRKRTKSRRIWRHCGRWPCRTRGISQTVAQCDVRIVCQLCFLLTKYINFQWWCPELIEFSVDDERQCKLNEPILCICFPRVIFFDVSISWRAISSERGRAWRTWEFFEVD